MLLHLRLSFKLLNRTHQILTHTHHGTQVSKLTAIIWSWKDRDKLFFESELITLLNNLMRPTNKVELVFLHKKVYHIFAIVVTDSSLEVLTPAIYTWLGIGPKHIRNCFVI